LIGYTPGSEKKKRHAIQVHVKQPGLDVHAHALKTRS